MRKFNIMIEERCIGITYDVSQEDIQNIIRISTICMKNHLSFLIGEDDFQHRFCHIYGYGETLQKCYNELVKEFS